MTGIASPMIKQRLGRRPTVSARPTAVDEDEVGERALLDDPELAGIGVARPRHRQKFGVDGGRHLQDFDRAVRRCSIALSPGTDVVRSRRRRPCRPRSSDRRATAPDRGRNIPRRFRRGCNPRARSPRPVRPDTAPTGASFPGPGAAPQVGRVRSSSQISLQAACARVRAV